MNALAILAIGGGVLLVFCGLKDQQPVDVLHQLLTGTLSTVKLGKGSTDYLHKYGLTVDDVHNARVRAAQEGKPLGYYLPGGAGWAAEHGHGHAATGGGGGGTGDTGTGSGGGGGGGGSF